MISSNYANLKIVNWDFVKKIDAHNFRRTKDPETVRKLIINFLNSSSLFADPSFCPAELVTKYFQLIQVSVSVMANQINSLNQTISEQKKEIKQLKKEQKTNKKKKIPEYILPPVVFQCVFCSKLFKTRTYLNNHIKRRHRERIYSIPLDQPPSEPKNEHIVKTVTNVPQISEDLGPFKAEINAMLDHFDTLLKNEQTSIRTDFAEQFHHINRMVQDTIRAVQEERANTLRRVQGSTDASYSDSEAMMERLQATDESEDTHIYSQHGDSDNENENDHRIKRSSANLNNSEESYYSSYSIHDGKFKNTSNINPSQNQTNVTPTTTTTVTIPNGSPQNIHIEEEEYSYSDV